MPEGHTVHRLARRQRTLFAGHTVRATSPQGRFAEGAAILDGHRLAATDAWGKHLFQVYDDLPDLRLHVHLGLFGRWRDGRTPAPEPRGALRLRMESDERWGDLRGPTACELLTEPEYDALLARLGPDPLRPVDDVNDPAAFLTRVGRSRAPAGTLLMDQSVVAGVGNVYRAEILFRHATHPRLPGRDVDPAVWAAMWDDLVGLMASGVRTGRIVTTEPDDRRLPEGRARRDDATYVYGRAGLPCRRCGTEVLAEDLAARRVFWCPFCQPGVGALRPSSA